MKIETKGGRTILTIEAAVVTRPKRRGRYPSQNAFYARRQIEGKCRNCGAGRKKYKHRCDQCQERERERHNRQYASRFHTIKKKPKTSVRQKRNIDDFLLDLRGWHRTGSDVVERIRRRRLRKDSLRDKGNL